MNNMPYLPMAYFGLFILLIWLLMRVSTRGFDLRRRISLRQMSDADAAAEPVERTTEPTPPEGGRPPA